ncbi:hypothetical protein CQW23_09218 [Capsicum baccatum]|uniref:Uncharacterized protein n=1 Tax=Capsicum baccatum TaxID=33114 RepID=A0A2G2WWA4_CAPBA|nr:hypothetical protein CQW23_09218 [Capsicum baccatum]
MEVEQLVGAVVAVFAEYDDGGSPERGGCMAAWLAFVGCFVFIDGMPEWWTTAKNREGEISNPKRREVHLGLVLKVDSQVPNPNRRKNLCLLQFNNQKVHNADGRPKKPKGISSYSCLIKHTHFCEISNKLLCPTTSRQGRVLPSSLTIRTFTKRGSGKKNFMDLSKSPHGHSKKVHPKKSGRDSSRDLSVPVLIRTIRRSKKEKVQMVSKVSSMLRNQVAERASAKEEANILQAELDSRTRRLETEKNELQLVLEKELDRRSNDWSLKLEKYQIEQHRLRERAREIAEQNVSLQR